MREMMTLPPGWVWTTLGQASKLNPRDPTLRDLEDRLPVSFLPMASVDAEQGRIVASAVRPLSEVRKGFTSFANGDVLFAKITPCMENGKAAIARNLKNGLGFGSTEFHVLRPEADVLTEWLFHFVRQEDFRKDAKAHFAGTAGQLRVSSVFLDSYPIPLPPLPEQRRIVAEIEKQFTRLDAGAAALKRVEATLRHYRASVLKAACEGRLVDQDPADEPADHLLARILAARRAKWEAEHPGKKYVEPAAPETDGLPELPRGWCWARVSQVGNVQLGRQRAPQYHDGPFMRPYLRVANVFEDHIDVSDVLHMNFDPQEYDRFMLRYGDILLNEGQSPELLGRPAMYRDEVPGACFQNTLVRFQAYDGLLAMFALCVFRSYMHSGRFRKIAQITTNIAHLSAGRFAEVEFPLPPLPEQHRIVAEVERRLSVVSEMEAAVATNLARAGRLRQAVLKRAFEGRLVAQDTSDEPAEALLAHIQAARETVGGRSPHPRGT